MFICWSLHLWKTSNQNVFNSWVNAQTTSSSQPIRIQKYFLLNLSQFFFFQGWKPVCGDVIFMVVHERTSVSFQTGEEEVLLTFFEQTPTLQYLTGDCQSVSRNVFFTLKRKIAIYTLWEIFIAFRYQFCNCHAKSCIFPRNIEFRIIYTQATTLSLCNA